jgi:hypothetical protein
MNRITSQRSSFHHQSQMVAVHQSSEVQGKKRVMVHKHFPPPKNSRKTMTVQESPKPQGMQ